MTPYGLECDGHNTLTPGAVVDYHGSRVDAHGRYVITATDEPRGRCTITDQNFPWFLLRKVRVANLTPTGEREILCTGCDHPAARRRSGAPNECAVDGCWCDTHSEPPSAWR